MSLKDFLAQNGLDSLSETLRNQMVSEIADLQFLSDEVVDSFPCLDVPKMKLKRIIKEIKTEAVVEEESRKHNQLLAIFATNLKSIQVLLDDNRITSTEFEKLRKLEFERVFNLVKYSFFQISSC